MTAALTAATTRATDRGQPHLGPDVPSVFLCGRGVLTRLDHLVILVRDLDRAVRGYEALGFTVTPGGEHADGLTRNALIPFADGSYLELVAFVDPEDARDNVWGWRTFLSSGRALIDYCAASDDLGADVRRLEERGLGVEGPTGGGRRLPDGTEIRWRVARIRQEGRLLPFLIEDLTPRSARVPGGPAAEHPNGATGISRLELATADVEMAARDLAVLTGDYPPRLGACELSLAARGRGARDLLDAAGPGPLAAGLAAGAGGEARELNRRLSGGADLRLLGGTTP
jgi:catechol 2,3-dioxygenase-like lactoylglutathione lyase family enzyme